MTTHGSLIIKTIESAWKAIQRRHPEVPNVVAITGTGVRPNGKGHGSRGGVKLSLAHFWGHRWQDRETEGAAIPELFVSGELLGMDGKVIMETLLHEAAHALNFARGIHDTTVNGYHNRLFITAAVELGLAWPFGATKHPTIGYSECLITEAAEKSYSRNIAALDSARLAHLATLADLTAANESGEEEESEEETPKRGKGSRGGTRGGKRIYVTCECPEPDAFPITPARLERAPILCGDCGQQFLARDGEVG